MRPFELFIMYCYNVENIQKLATRSIKNNNNRQAAYLFKWYNALDLSDVYERKVIIFIHSKVTGNLRRLFKKFCNNNHDMHDKDKN